MMAISSRARVAAAVITLESNRMEAKALLGPHSDAETGGQPGVFPRSKTFRWLMQHPVGRWLGSAVLTGALARLPLGRFVGAWIFSRKT